MATSIEVIFPGRPSSSPNRPSYPVLYLLHGLSDDQTAWMRKTSIERYAEEHGIAVVMPSGGRSFYADQVHGLAYWTYLSMELPAVVRQWLPVSTRREDTFVAGLSMGGYGAFKLALNFPERFLAAASLSGCLALAAERRKTDAGLRKTLEDSFGTLGAIRGTNNDLAALIKRQSRDKTHLPFLYQACGRDDFLIDENRDFHALTRKLNIATSYTEDRGTHNWEYWDRHIQLVLKWMMKLRAPS